MLFLSLLLVFITCPVTGAKKHHHKHEDVPRFVIPRPESRQETAFIPEAISVVKKSGSIVGTELPGAYGEDFEIDNGSESGTSGSGVSGSGSDKDDVLFVANNGGGEAAETAGKYGNNEQPKPGINPANAFVNNMKDADDEETEAEKGQATATAKTETNKAEKTDKTSEKPKKTVEVEKTIKAVKPEKTEKQRSSKKRTKVKAKSSQNPDENNMISKIDAIARQIEKVEHREKLDRKEEATLKVAKKVAKKVIKDMKQNEHRDVSPGTVKAIAKAIDLDQTDKKDNAPAEEPKEPEICPLSYPYAFHGGSRCCKINQDKQGAALSLASESCDSDNDRECPSGRCKDNNLFIGDAFGGTQLSDDTDDIKEEQLYIQNFKKSQETSKTEKLVEELIKGGPVEPKDSIKNSDTKKEISKSPEMKKQSPDNLQNGTEKSNVVDFECPWACFWQCHSYCPSQCCHNPRHCDWTCKEYCGAPCSEECCAPGVQRMAAYQPETAQKDDINNATNPTTTTTTTTTSSPITTASSTTAKSTPSTTVKAIETKPVEKEEKKPKADAAENALEQEKEQADDIAFVSQLEALRKATHYAAEVMGLPPDCPAACAQICLPGWCSKHCCAKSILPLTLRGATSVPQSIPYVATSNARMVPGNAAVPHYPNINQLRKVSTSEIMKAQRKHLLSLQNSPQRKAAMKKYALQRKLISSRHMMSPAAARLNALAYMNRINRMNRRKMLMRKSQSRALQFARAYCKYSRRCQPSYSPPAMHSCNKICRLSCIPQCPNECCTVGAKKKNIPRARHGSHGRQRVHG